MKKMSFILTIAVLFLMSSSLFSQSLEEILEGYYEAVNQEVLSDVQSIKAEGKIVMMGMEIPFVSYQERPLKYRTEGTYQGMTFIQATDGETGWMMNPFMGMTDAQPITDDDLDALLEQADIDGYLYNYEEKGMTAEYTGEEEFEGTPSYVIKMTDEDGETFTFYVDKDTYLVLGMNANRMMQGKEVEMTTVMGNYQEVDGIVIPFSITSKVADQKTEIVMEKITIDEPIDDSIFAMPVADDNEEETDKETE